MIVEALPDEKYLDRDSGEELEVIAQLLPLAPTMAMVLTERRMVLIRVSG